MTSRPGRAGQRIAWLALGIGFSPVLAELADNLVHAPEDRGTLLFPFLFAVAALGESRAAGRRPRAGAIVLGLAGLLEITGILTGTGSIARLAFPVAVLGLAVWFGQPSPRVTALLFWAVPIPDFVAALGSPDLESLLGGWAAAPWAGLGFEISASGPLLQAPSGLLRLVPSDAGLGLAALMAGVGWFTVLGSSRGLRIPVQHALLWTVWALPIQWISLSVAVGLLAAFGPPAARTWLTYGAWLAVAAAGLLSARRRRRPADASNS